MIHTCRNGLLLLIISIFCHNLTDHSHKLGTASPFKLLISLLYISILILSLHILNSIFISSFHQTRASKTCESCWHCGFWLNNSYRNICEQFLVTFCWISVPKTCSSLTWAYWPVQNNLVYDFDSGLADCHWKYDLVSIYMIYAP
jgi:hypothetical protein